jgi:hypothetical protein
MLQSTQSIQSTPLSLKPSQWNPMDTLNLTLKPDGRFTCSGVKNNSNDPCGWHLSKETVPNIGNLLDYMSNLPPQDAIPSLDSLTAITLCHNHESQKRFKVAQWTRAIHRISLTQAGPNIVELYGSSPPQRPATTSQSTSSLPPYSNGLSEPPYSHVQLNGRKESSSAVQSSHIPFQEQIHDLQEEVKLQTARILILEASCREFTNAASTRKRLDWSWARISARLRTFLKKDG